MKKAIAVAIAGALALAIASGPASATTPKYPAYKETVTQVGPGPLSISVRQLDTTHTAFNLRTPRDAGSKAIFVLEHFVCASRSRWQVGLPATSTCTPRTAAHSVQFRYTPSGGIVATFAHSGPSYGCVGRVTGSIKAKSLACLAANSSTPRASHGTGRYVLNPGASSHDDGVTPAVDLTGRSGASLGYGDNYTSGAFTVNAFVPYVHNGTDAIVVVQSVWTTTITTSDPACPASDVVVGVWGNGTNGTVDGFNIVVPGVIDVGGMMLEPGRTVCFLPQMVIIYPTADTACQTDTIAVGLESN